MGNAQSKQITATYVGKGIMGKYQPHKQYTLQIARQNGEVHIIHAPTQEIETTYKSEQDFLNDWKDAKERDLLLE
ncbi:hypothetical protein [Hymenobacter jeollabukensis]|uniref:Uncharacterized protein n=1 Tax=Hymenobacter jeollabukensis TaxID=2025313 RepID=A0A5R8WUW0_9BACT|nr:hypothetical protein [Hymenobacter jeollabukensis]TLM95561.1 hypothetical protein FDY95_07195 [Hymenobacter jeollabukensis]